MSKIEFVFYKLSPFYWKRFHCFFTFAGLVLLVCKILSRYLSSWNILKMPFYCFLISSISVEKAILSFIFIPVKFMLFILSSNNILSLFPSDSGLGCRFCKVDFLPLIHKCDWKIAHQVQDPGYSVLPFLR